jgi:hypothetical protein
MKRFFKKDAGPPSYFSPRDCRRVAGEIFQSSGGGNYSQDAKILVKGAGSFMREASSQTGQAVRSWASSVNQSTSGLNVRTWVSSGR